VIATISSDQVDRQGEVVLPSGLVKAQFNKNPIVLCNHQWDTLPIGKCLWIKQQKNTLIAKYQLADTPDGNIILKLLQEGVLTSHSIYFNALEVTPPTAEEIVKRPDWKSCSKVFREWELLEFSVVTLPANTDATALAVAKGFRQS